MGQNIVTELDAWLTFFSCTDSEHIVRLAQEVKSVKEELDSAKSELDSAKKESMAKDTLIESLKHNK